MKQKSKRCTDKRKYNMNYKFFESFDEIMEFLQRKHILMPIVFLQYIWPMYIPEFAKGNLHFGSIAKYLNMAYVSGDSNIGDIYEGKYTYENLSSNYLMPHIQASHQKYVGSPIEIGLNAEEQKRWGIISFFSLFATDFVKKDDGYWHLKSNLCDNLINNLSKLKSDTNKKLVIMDNAPQVIKELSDKNIFNRPIIYGNQKELGLNPIINFQQIKQSILFYKRANYSFQREYRFIKDVSKTKVVHVRAIQRNAKFIDFTNLRALRMKSVGGINLYLR